MSPGSDPERPPAFEGGESGKPLSRRALTRLAAVQALYQVEMAGQTPARVIAEFLAHRLDDGAAHGSAEGAPPPAELDRALFEALVAGVARESDQLDDMLSAVLAEDWPVERLDRVLRLILRAGAHELEHFAETPSRVVISEDMTLADGFFFGKEPAMTNAVLDRLAKVLRPDEFPDAGDSLLTEGLS